MKSRFIFLSVIAACILLHNFIAASILLHNFYRYSAQDPQSEFDRLMSISASELRQHVLDSGIDIENNKYFDLVLKTVVKIDALFRDNTKSIADILSEYRDILVDEENEFTVNINNFYKQPTKEAAKKMLGITCLCHEKETCVHKDIYKFTTICIFNYTYARKNYGFTYRKNLNREYRMLAALIHPDHQIISTNKKISGSIFNYCKDLYKNTDLEDDSLFQALSEKYAANDPWKKAGLYHLFTHYIHQEYKEVLLEHGNGNIPILLCYKYFFRPLTEKLLISGYCDEDLLKKIVKHCIAQSSKKELSLLENFGKKIVNSDKYSDNVKNIINNSVLQIIGISETKVNIRDEKYIIKSNQNFWSKAKVKIRDEEIIAHHVLNDEMLKNNCFEIDSNIFLSFRVLQRYDGDYRAAFNKQNGFSKNLLDQDDDVFDEMDKYIAENLKNDPVQNAEKHYRLREGSWWKKISALGLYVAQTVAPQIFEMLNAAEENPLEKIRLAQELAQLDGLESYTDRLTGIYSNNAVSIRLSEKRLAHESKTDFLILQAKKNSLRQQGPII